LLCEANQWPEDVRPYFGGGDEFHMGFHFPIMPRIFMALKKGRTDDMIEILDRTPAIPDNCQWCIFLRNHDELTLEMVTPEERQWMWEQYAPEPRMKLNLGIRRRLAPLLDNDRRKVELINSLLFTLPGSPIIYYGDEIGMGDNVDLPDRNGVRTPMQWDDSPNGGFSTGTPFTEFVKGELDYHHVNVKSQLADKDSLFHAISKMIQVRKQHHLFGRGTMKWVLTDHPTLAVYTRKYRDEVLLVIHNLSDTTQTFTFPQEHRAVYVDLLSSREQKVNSALTLQPYGYYWLKR
jgi:maltose alpha-D-glucosyltransferase / alpha-amylase